VSSETCYQGQVVEIDHQLHTDTYKRDMLQILLNDTSRLVRLDSTASPFSVNKLLAHIMDALFQPVTDTRLWDLQLEFIRILLGLAKTETKKLNAKIMAELKLALDRVDHTLKSVENPSATMLAHAHLCAAMIRNGLLVFKDV
jgi:hypothetical protein